MRTYRVIQWATGGVGRAAIEGVLDAPATSSWSGAGSTRSAKDGTDVGELIGREPDRRHRHPTTWTPCWRSTPTASSTRRCSPTRRTWPASSSRARTSSTPLGWFYPEAEDVADLEAACRGRRRRRCTAPASTRAGSPSGSRSWCRRCRAAITRVRAEEFSDIRTYDAPDVVRDVMLFGATPDEARTSVMATVLGAGLRPVDAHGRRRARVRHRPRAANHPRGRGGDRSPSTRPIGPIGPGQGRGAAVPVGGHWSTGTRSSPRR